MSGTWILFRRELAGLFLSPLAWVLLWIALLMNGAFLLLYLSASGGDVTTALDACLGEGFLFWVLLIVLPPLLSMRLVSEETRSGTLEYLLTAPVTDAGVVLGKYLAAWAFMAILWLSVLIYGGTVHVLGVTPDWSALIGGYVGAVLASGMFVAIGMLVSSFTATPILAAFLGVVACLLFLTLPFLAELVVSQVTLLLGQFPDFAEQLQTITRTVVAQVNVGAHLQGSFLMGVFDTSELVFFVSWIAFFLFLTVRSMEMRRWRG